MLHIGAFLIPYVIVLICGGVPVFFLEVAVGQLMSQGGYGVWMICPLMKGRYRNWIWLKINQFKHFEAYQIVTC